MLGILEKLQPETPEPPNECGTKKTPEPQAAVCSPTTEPDPDSSPPAALSPVNCEGWQGNCPTTVPQNCRSDSCMSVSV